MLVAESREGHQQDVNIRALASVGLTGGDGRRGRQAGPRIPLASLRESGATCLAESSGSGWDDDSFSLGVWC